MNQDLTAYIYSFSSVITFSTAAIGFTYFSHKVSPLWMNVFKCFISTLFCIPVLMFFDKSLFWSPVDYWPFYLSGFIGLNVADWFLLTSYRIMGPGRTLVLFGFQPLAVGTFSYLAWGEELHGMQFVAILFFILCLFLFSYERFKASGRWEVRGLLLALCGVFFDSIGILLTRYGFDQNPGVNGLEAHYVRVSVALLSFVIYTPFIKIHFINGFRKLSLRDKNLAVVSSFFGTFLSLILYLQALKIGKLATVTAIILSDPMITTFLESVWLKVWPSRYLWLALLSLIVAMFFLFYPQWFPV